MVCGTDKSKSGEVWIKNVVYREVFESHSQIEPIEDIDEICYLLNETFPSSQLTMTPLPEDIAHAKREFAQIYLMAKVKSLNFMSLMSILLAHWKL